MVYLKSFNWKRKETRQINSASLVERVIMKIGEIIHFRAEDLGFREMNEDAPVHWTSRAVERKNNFTTTSKVARPSQ